MKEFDEKWWVDERGVRQMVEEEKKMGLWG